MCVCISSSITSGSRVVRYLCAAVHASDDIPADTGGQGGTDRDTVTYLANNTREAATGSGDDDDDRDIYLYPATERSSPAHECGPPLGIKM